MFFASVFLFFLAVGVFIGVFQWQGRAIATVDFRAEYHFLLRDCGALTADVAAGDSYLAGGAGYLLESEDAVVLACYYKKTDAEFVQEAMAAKGVETRVFSRETKRFTLSGKRAAEGARVEANAATLDSCARLLFDTANGLERAGIGQSEARAAVEGVISSLSGLASENGGDMYTLWNAELYRAARRGRELVSGILFAKDLRYLQIELVFSILSLGDYFA